MLLRRQDQRVARSARDDLAKDLISMTTGSTYASQNSTAARVAAAFVKARQQRDEARRRREDRRQFQLQVLLGAHGLVVHQEAAPFRCE
jgi:hypothetical protein